jgi:hypothetical protein
MANFARINIEAELTLLRAQPVGSIAPAGAASRIVEAALHDSERNHAQLMTLSAQARDLARDILARMQSTRQALDVLEQQRQNRDVSRVEAIVARIEGYRAEISDTYSGVAGLLTELSNAQMPWRGSWPEIARQLHVREALIASGLRARQTQFEELGIAKSLIAEVKAIDQQASLLDEWKWYAIDPYSPTARQEMDALAVQIAGTIDEVMQTLAQATRAADNIIQHPDVQDLAGFTRQRHAATRARDTAANLRTQLALINFQYSELTQRLGYTNEAERKDLAERIGAATPLIAALGDRAEECMTISARHAQLFRAPNYRDPVPAPPPAPPPRQRGGLRTWLKHWVSGQSSTSP